MSVGGGDTAVGMARGRHAGSKSSAFGEHVARFFVLVFVSLAVKDGGRRGGGGGGLRVGRLRGLALVAWVAVRGGGGEDYHEHRKHEYGAGGRVLSGHSMDSPKDIHVRLMIVWRLKCRDQPLWDEASVSVVAVRGVRMASKSSILTA